MGFGKRKRKVSTKLIVISIAIALLFMVTVTFSAIKYIKMKNYYENELLKANEQLKVSKVTVLIPNRPIAAGEQLDESMFTTKQILSDIDYKYYATNEIIGKYARFTLQQSLPLMRYMIVDEQITGDIREEEYNMFLLPSNLKKNQYVDLRIIFPTGENYVVASKLKIRNIDLTKNTIWCWLKEREILTITCAIVDAYVREGTKLYFVTYIEPDAQRPSVVNYKPNANVISLIENNPNIIDNASDALAKSIRGLLEDRLKKTDSMEIQMIKQGNDIEAQKRQGQLTPSVESETTEENGEASEEPISNNLDSTENISEKRVPPSTPSNTAPKTDGTSQSESMENFTFPETETEIIEGGASEPPKK